MINKNNLKVKLADGLTEVGISQVKAEVGGGSGSVGHFLLMNGDKNPLLLNPNTNVTYVEEIGENNPPQTDDEAVALVNRIATDYNLTFIDLREKQQEQTDFVGYITTNDVTDFIRFVEVLTYEIDEETSVRAGQLVQSENIYSALPVECEFGADHLEIRFDDFIVCGWYWE